MINKRILVIGSSNTDMTIKANRLPLPGETVLGGTFNMGFGGKGANQAVAAKRLGGEVTFVCKVGKDTFGTACIERYEKEGIDISNVMRSDSASGVALITVDSNGENSIAVASGANADFSIADVRRIENIIASARILLLQLETPLDTVLTAAEIGHKNGVFVVLNPAPAIDLPAELFKYISLIIPNETEVSMLTGITVNDFDSAAAAADVLISKGVEKVIVTMGARGSLLRFKGRSFIMPSEKVVALDTTAAGDTFCGGICVAIAEGMSLESAVKFATKASSLTVQKIGAQDSIPRREEIIY